MNPHSYFTELREEFQNDPYRDRFLQELRDHAEDLESYLPKKSLTSDFMEKQFGDAKTVKKTFNATLRPEQKGWEAVEALGYGIWMILCLAFSALLPYVMEVQWPLLMLLLFIPYFFVWRHLFSEDRLLSKVALLGLVLLPIVLFSLSASWRTYTFWSESGSHDLTSYPILTLMSLGMGLLAFGAAFLLQKRSRVISEDKIQFFPKIMGSLAFVYVLAYSVLRFLNPALTFELYSFELDSWWTLLFVPLHHTEMGLMYLPSALTGSIVGLHYFQILIVLGFLGLGAGYFLIKKRFSFLALMATVYALGLLLVPQKGMYETERYSLGNLNFQVPYEEISKKIQRRQFGPFSTLVEHLENRYLFGSGYLLEPHDGQFILHQFGSTGSIQREINTSPFAFKGSTFLFDPEKNELSSASKTLSLSKIPTHSLSASPPLVWPKGFECEYEGGQLAYDVSCLKLLFEKTPLLTGSFHVQDVALSTDGRFLMLVLSHQPGSQSVYVLDLSDVNLR